MYKVTRRLVPIHILCSHIRVCVSVCVCLSQVILHTRRISPRSPELYAFANNSIGSNVRTHGTTVTVTPSSWLSHSCVYVCMFRTNEYSPQSSLKQRQTGRDPFVARTRYILINIELHYIFKRVENIYVKYCAHKGPRVGTGALGRLEGVNVALECQ